MVLEEIHNMINKAKKNRAKKKMDKKGNKAARKAIASKDERSLAYLLDDKQTDKGKSNDPYEWNKFRRKNARFNAVNRKNTVGKRTKQVKNNAKK